MGEVTDLDTTAEVDTSLVVNEPPKKPTGKAASTPASKSATPAGKATPASKTSTPAAKPAAKVKETPKIVETPKTVPARGKLPKLVRRKPQQRKPLLQPQLQNQLLQTVNHQRKKSSRRFPDRGEH